MKTTCSKNAAVVAILVAISTASFTSLRAEGMASNRTDNSQEAHSMSMSSGSMSNSVMMKDGKLMVMKDGAYTLMTEDVSMSDGSKVLINGTIQAKDGKTKMMKEGQSISSDGKMMDHSTTK